MISHRFLRKCIQLTQFLYPATLKSAGYYIIPSIQKIMFECPSVSASFSLSAGSILCPQRIFGRHIVIAPSVCPSSFRVQYISPIFFEVGIPNLVCGYIFGWRSVAYHFRVTVTLTSDLVFRIIVSRAYLLYCLR